LLQRLKKEAEKNNMTTSSDAKTQEDQLVELKKLNASLSDAETQESQLTELKKLNASLPGIETHENQLEELKKLNVHALRYDKIIIGIGIATLIISILVAIK
jgi:hypothetical protein